MSTVTFEGVTKKYGEVLAVDNLSLEIVDGEFMVLVGPSGCGKTTSLRMIAGLEDITAGTLKIGDVVVNDKAPKDRDIAMVFQSYALYPHMTVKENLAFGLKLRKVSKDEIDRRVNEAAAILDLAKLLARKPKELSGGQRQRVCIARALAVRPKALLLDEPTSALDVTVQARILELLKRLQGEHSLTYLLITHNLAVVASLCTQVIVMYAGRAVETAPVARSTASKRKKRSR